MSRYEIGKRFPHLGFENVTPTAAFSLTEKAIDLTLFLPHVTAVEVQDFNIATLHYGLYVQDHIPFMVIKLKEMEFDGAFNILQQSRIQNLTWLKSKEDTLSMFLVDSKSYLIKGLREVKLDNRFIEMLRNTLASQTIKYRTSHDVDQKITFIQASTPVKNMYRKSMKYHTTPKLR